MREIIAAKGLTILEEEKPIFNIDKFFVRVKIHTGDSLLFKLDFSSCTQLSNIFQFETTISSWHTIRLQ